MTTIKTRFGMWSGTTDRLIVVERHENHYFCAEFFCHDMYASSNHPTYLREAPITTREKYNRAMPTAFRFFRRSCAAERYYARKTIQFTTSYMNMVILNWTVLAHAQRRRALTAAAASAACSIVTAVLPSRTAWRLVVIFRNLRPSRAENTGQRSGS